MVLDYRTGFGDAYKAKREGIAFDKKQQAAAGSFGSRTPGIGSQYQNMAQRMRYPGQYSQMALGALPDQRSAMRMAGADAMSRFKPAQGMAEREAARRGLGGLSKASITKLAIAGASGSAGAASRAASQARRDRFMALQRLGDSEMRRNSMEMGAYDRAAGLARHEDAMAMAREAAYDRMSTERGQFYDDRGGDPFEQDPYGRRRTTGIGAPGSLSGGGTGLDGSPKPRKQALPVEGPKTEKQTAAENQYALPADLQQPATASQPAPSGKVSDIHRGEGGRIGGIGSLSRSGLREGEHIDAGGFIVPDVDPKTTRNDEYKKQRESVGDFVKSQPIVPESEIERVYGITPDIYKKYGTPEEMKRKITIGSYGRELEKKPLEEQAEQQAQDWLDEKRLPADATADEIEAEIKGTRIRESPLDREADEAELMRQYNEQNQGRSDRVDSAPAQDDGGRSARQKDATKSYYDYWTDREKKAGREVDTNQDPEEWWKGLTPPERATIRSEQAHRLDQKDAAKSSEPKPMGPRRGTKEYEKAFDQFREKLKEDLKNGKFKQEYTGIDKLFVDGNEYTIE